MTIAESFECPPSETLRDCLCYPKSKTIRCIDANLLPLFTESSTLNQEFNLITFENIKLSIIERKDLGNAWFKKIVIENNPILETLSDDIFKISPEVLIIRNNPVLKMGLLSAVKNLEKTQIIQIENNHQIISVGNRAFGDSLKLKQIFLKNNQIEEIAEEAFLGLPDLKEIRLDHNKIKNLYKKSFDVSSKIIEINLNSNDMLTANIEGITSKSETTITLYLENTNLSNFPKNIFEPFLANNKSTLYLDGNHFQCLCDDNNAIWVLDEIYPYLSRQIIHLHCTNHGNEIFRLTRKDICGVETTTSSTIEPQPPTEQPERKEPEVIKPIQEPDPPKEQPERKEPEVIKPIQEPDPPKEQPERKEPEVIKPIQEPDPPKEQPERKEPEVIKPILEPDPPKEQLDRKEPGQLIK